MTEKQNRGSTLPNGTSPDSAAPLSLTTNGGSKDAGTVKPKTPAKPSRLTRAFSSGSIGLRKKTKKKVKSVKISTMDDALRNEIVPKENGHRENGIGTGAKENGIGTGAKENGIEIGTKENGIEIGPNQDEKETQLWKLPGIGSVPKLKSPKTLQQSSSDSSILERKLPSIPQSDSINRELLDKLLERRQLPPIPDCDLECDKRNLPLSESPTAIPETMVSPAYENVPIELLKENGQLLSVNGPSSYREGDLVTKGRLSPVPEASPSLTDPDNGSEFRPVPQTPPLSDCDGISLQSQGLRDSNVSLSEAEGKNDIEGASNKIKISELVKNNSSSISLTASTLSSSSFSPTEPQDEASLQRGEADEELHDYTIAEIVSSFSYALPVRVKIAQGYCSDTTEVNISTDDIYNIHSIQHSKKVTVKGEDGMTHRISLDAQVKIGLVYNPENKEELSLSGYNFKNIAEVTSMPVLPKLISATQAVNCGDEKNSVSEGEIFVVKQVQRSVFKGKKGLKVYSLIAGSNKVLFDDCQGNFTTKPSLVRLGLPEFLENVEDKFPSRAVIYPTTDDLSSSGFPVTLSRVVTLLECKTDTALVVSDISFMDDNELEEANHIPIPTSSPTSFDLLLDDDISALEVAVLKWTYHDDDYTEESDHHVYDDTFGVEGVSPSPVASGTEIPSPAPGDGNVDVLSADALHGNVDDHMYMNLQLQQPAALSSEDLTEKEKTFLEEDEDAGYDTVGLHLIGGDHPSSADDTLLCSSSDPLASEGQGTGYSTVHHHSKSEEPASFPFPNHGYSEVNQKRTPKRKTTPHSDYSMVSPHHTVNGVVKEMNLGDIQVTEESGEVGVVRESQLSSMMDGLEQRLMALHNTHQSTEMTKMQSVLEMLTAKLEAVDTQLNTLTLPMAASNKTADTIPPKAADDGPPKAADNGFPKAADDVPPKAADDVPPEAADDVPPEAADDVPPKAAGDVPPEAADDGPPKAADDVPPTAAGDVPSKPETSAEQKMLDLNRDYLKSLDENQIGKLFQLMKLSQYSQTVIEEQITGEILMECDEAVLQEELGIGSKIHRIRVLKIISGQHSAKTSLEKDNK